VQEVMGRPGCHAIVCSADITGSARRMKAIVSPRTAMPCRNIASHREYVTEQCQRTDSMSCTSIIPSLPIFLCPTDDIPREVCHTDRPSGKGSCKSDPRRDGGGVRDGELAPVVLAPGFDAQEMTRISLQGLSISAVTRGVARSAKETYRVMLYRPSPPLSTRARARRSETHQKTC
jgi:hypothetical protein